MNTYTAKVPGCYGNKLGRQVALRDCVSNVPSLHIEFLNSIHDIHSMTTEDYTRESERFIVDKKVRVVTEKPIAYLDGDRYRVDVFYTCTWG